MKQEQVRRSKSKATSRRQSDGQHDAGPGDRDRANAAHSRAQGVSQAARAFLARTA